MLTLMMADDVCGDRKTSDFGTVVFRNTIGLVVRQCLCGVVSYDGSTDLYIIQNGSLTGVRYRDEILDAFVRLYAGAVGQDFVFMDDNARPHRARVATVYLEREEVDRMNWPARSPDINPIEHVWDILQRRISARLVQPQTREDLT